MEHLPEFIANNLFLCVAFVIVLGLTIAAEIAHQTSKANDLSPTQATRHMNNENAVVVDVNDTAVFAKGHINNAINIPMAELANKLSELQPYKDKALLTYCTSGKQSSRACKLLKRSGFNKVHNIAGGLNNWLESNLPVIRNT